MDFLKQLLRRWNKGYCTWFFDRIFGVNISDICYDHDAAYSAAAANLKIKGDWQFFLALLERAKRQKGWRKPAMVVVAGSMTFVVGTFGWLFWMASVVKHLKRERSELLEN